MLVVDLLHEFELGVWKAIFTHLLRLLDALKPSMVHELDHQLDFLEYLVISVDTMFRYRQVPTFSCDTIRRFCTNSSEMKKMAARDFEDLLLIWSLLFISSLVLQCG